MHVFMSTALLELHEWLTIRNVNFPFMIGDQIFVLKLAFDELALFPISFSRGMENIKAHAGVQKSRGDITTQKSTPLCSPVYSLQIMEL